MARSESLDSYRAKRNFAVSGEPAGGGQANQAAPSFVIQKHWASRLHYDFRLELDGSMKSWAIPKGPSLDPRDKRLAVRVEDHPIAYNAFEGEIPPKQYGAGKVIIWDKGTWIPLSDPHEAIRAGHLKFELAGCKLQGKWALIRMKVTEAEKETWLLVKERDDHARSAPAYSVVDAQPDSVAALPAPKAAAPKKKTSSPPRRKTTSPTRNVFPAAAIAAPLPALLKPQLATLVDRPPAEPDDWFYEIKFDGYRMLARVDAKSIRLFTRNGKDWSRKLPSLIAALEKLDLAPGWLDGEIVVPDDHGIPHFQALQNALDEVRSNDIVYYLFDVPFYAGRDLRAVPQIERKNFLAGILGKAAAGAIRFSDTFDVSPDSVLDSACRLRLEGVIGKRRSAGYASSRSRDWIKLKCTRRQEFVIGGYTDPQGARTGIGSLLLGVYDDAGHLHYSGNVGTGFDRKTLDDLKSRLTARAIAESPFTDSVGIRRAAHWVRPGLVAEVSFAEWTQAGRIRHGVYQGLRADKPAKTVVRETPATPPGRKTRSAASAARVTHPDRVIDPSTETTKLELVQFYSRVAPLMMEHLKERPVSLVRVPSGVTGPFFFQKHLESAQIQGLRELDRSLDPGHPPLLEIEKPEGLAGAAQMNVIEFHTWNARTSNIDRPDRMTFDLDPGEGVSWPAVQESAHLVREFLTALGLVSFVKTSGGKGLHIVVPLKRLYDWDTVKGFSRAIVQHLAATLPQRFTAKSGPRNRVGKIFIDYLRNGFGATTVSAWSVRARPGLGASVPIAWAELASLSGAAHWTLANIEPRLKTGNTPWKTYARAAQSLGRAMNTLGFDPRTPG